MVLGVFRVSYPSADVKRIPTEYCHTLILNIIWSQLLHAYINDLIGSNISYINGVAIHKVLLNHNQLDTEYIVPYI